MKRIFFIDKENTGSRFLKGLNGLTKNDMLVIFHYEQAGNIRPEVLLALSKTKASIEIIRMNTHTKNAMDFQICTYMGYMYNLYKRTAEYYIVSDDKGYQACIEFIKTHIDPKAIIGQVNSNMSLQETKETLVDDLLKDKYQRKVINKIKKGLLQSKDKGEFHNYLQKNLNNDFEQIYLLLKPMFSEAKMAVV